MSKQSLGLAIALLSSVATAQCITGPGAMVPVLQDFITAPMPIGFAFPIDGMTYTDIAISDHGICFLSNGGVPASPSPDPLVYTPVAASLVANGPVICPHWSDTIPGTAGTFFLDAQPTECTITWVDVESFGYPTPQMSFQCRLFPSGQVEFIYGPNVTNNSTFGGVSNNGVVGISPGAPAVLPAAVDLLASPTTSDGTIFEDWQTANTFDMAGDSLLFTPAVPGPGWVVVHTPGGANCARAESYGPGCDGLTLASNLPVRGTNWDLTTTGINAVSQLSFTYLSLTRANPSVPLGAFGFNAPGCEAHLPIAGPLALRIATVAAGSATFSISIPTGPGFVGLKLTAQSIGLTPNNGAGLATSNGLEGTVGN